MAVPPEHEGQTPPGPRVAALRAAYLEAILDGELRSAERVIRDAIDSGLIESRIATEIITPAMVAVGNGWARGEVGIADEHLATDISLRMIALQRESFRVARRRSSATVLLAAVEGERHVIGLEMAASALLHAGFDVRMLGADVPSNSVAEAVERLRPAVLGLTTTTSQSAWEVRGAIERARRFDASVGVVIGGAAADHAVRKDPGTEVCTSVGDVVEIVDALVQRASLN